MKVKGIIEQSLYTELMVTKGMFVSSRMFVLAKP